MILSSNFVIITFQKLSNIPSIELQQLLRFYLPSEIFIFSDIFNPMNTDASELTVEQTWDTWIFAGGLA